MLQILFVVATLLSTIGPAFSYVHDMILPHHTPEPGYCEGGCAQWQMNRTASSFFSSTNASVRICAAAAFSRKPSLSGTMSVQNKLRREPVTISSAAHVKSLFIDLTTSSSYPYIHYIYIYYILHLRRYLRVTIIYYSVPKAVRNLTCS